MKRRLILMVAMSLIAIAAGFAIKAEFFGPPDVTMMTAPVTTGNVEETVLTSGTLKPVKLVAVGAQASGRITSLKVSLGQKVGKNDLVAEIDSVTQQNALRTAKAALSNVLAQRGEKEATLAHAESTLARQKRMVVQKAVSQADFETAEAEVKTTRAQIEALDAQIIEAEVAVETAQANLGYTRITAPIDGTVLAIVSQEGQTVNAAQSAPTIVVLGQLDTMTVLAEISEADVTKVKPGQQVYFTILGDPDCRYEATLDSIEPAPESITSDSSITSSSSSSSSGSSSSTSSAAIYYNGHFNIPNPDGRLRTYMTAEVHIILGEAKGVTTIPAAALSDKDRDGKYVVQVVDQKGQFSSRKIEVGLNNKMTAEVLSGLKEGERVITGRISPETQTTTKRDAGGPPPMGL